MIAEGDRRKAKKNQIEKQLKNLRGWVQLDAGTKAYDKAIEGCEALNRQAAEFSPQLLGKRNEIEQARRRILLENPEPGDPQLIQQQGWIYTPEELAQAQQAAAAFGTAEAAADTYVGTLIKDGTLQAATRLRSQPFQMANGPPVDGSMFVIYQFRYTSKVGVVMDREGYVVVTRRSDGYWFPSQMTKLAGVHFP
jgi:hypothetical protein